MYFTYILKSVITEKYYTGSTSNLDERIKAHNSGKTKSTKPFRPWILVYKEAFETRTEARKRENQIKRYKGGRAFKELIQ